MTRFGRPLVTMVTCTAAVIGAQGYVQSVKPAATIPKVVMSINYGPMDVVRGGFQRLPLPLRRQGTVSSAATSTAAVPAPAQPSKPSSAKSLASATVLLLLDVAMRWIFQQADISFPSSLAGCGALFASLLALDIVSNGNFGNRIFHLLSPGAALLAKWLPVFFVPSLVMLPLADGLGSAAEFAKVGAVVIGGFFFTLLTTAGSVVGVSKLLSSSAVEEAVTEASKSVAVSSAKPFSDNLFRTLQFLSIATGIASVVAIRSSTTAAATAAASIRWQRPMASFFLLMTTLFSFAAGARMPKSITGIVHPLVTCTTYTWGAVSTFGLLTGLTFKGILRTYYRTGSFSFRDLRAAGAGDVLLFLLGPAVVSLAISMYDKRKLMKDNLAEVLTAIAVSSLGGLFGTAAMVRAVGIASGFVRTSLLPRNITSPLAMAIANILMGAGADVSLAVSMVVVTGLIGANFGARILTACGITDPVARGLGMGAAAHGLGTAAIVNEDEAFPFAAIGMALTASACTVLVSINAVKKMVLKLALG